MRFYRQDEWSSIRGLTEFSMREIPDTWKLITQEGKDLSTRKVKHYSFPANQDELSTLVFVDDDYTYIVNRVHCYDNHAGPQLMAFILRLDKKEAV